MWTYNTTEADAEERAENKATSFVEAEANNAEMQKASVTFKRKPWFEKVKSIIRIFIKETTFEYLGEKPNGKCIILCNHVGTAAPLAWELYSGIPFRFWGADEMNKSLTSLYKYQSRIFYHEKKGWNIHLARLFCLIASPLTYMFYRGLDLISTYKDTRFRKTISESLEAFSKEQAVVIFPEKSDNGYLDVLEGFHAGFTVLGGIALKKGTDLPVYVAYFKKGEKRCIVDKPVMWSALENKYTSREKIAEVLCDRCNELGQDY